MEKVIVGTFARRDEKGNFLASVPIYQELTPELEEERSKTLDEFSHFLYEKMSRAKLLQNKRKNERKTKNEKKST